MITLDSWNAVRWSKECSWTLGSVLLSVLNVSVAVVRLLSALINYEVYQSFCSNITFGPPHTTSSLSRRWIKCERERAVVKPCDNSTIFYENHCSFWKRSREWVILTLCRTQSLLGYLIQWTDMEEDWIRWQLSEFLNTNKELWSNAETPAHINQPETFH